MDFASLLGGPQYEARSQPTDVQIMELKEFLSKFKRPNPFKVGDIITPRKGSPYRGADSPHIVVEILTDSDRYLEGNSGSNAYGAVHDIRVAHMEQSGENSWTPIMHCVESCYFELFEQPALVAA